MKRDYAEGIKENIDFFIGKEVEQTKTKGMQTLFVVGLQRHNVILKYAEKNKCKHIYFGANHSFKTLAGDEVQSIYNQLKYFLDKGYWVTFDTSPTPRFEDIHNLLSNRKFTIVSETPISNKYFTIRSLNVFFSELWTNNLTGSPVSSLYFTQ